MDHWLALSIGNSRLHWAGFQGNTLQEAWETRYLSATQINSLVSNSGLEQLPPALLACLTQVEHPELWIASVVPGQTALWQAYPGIKTISLDQVPLRATYLTLGVDRALAVWGAGQIHGWPVLVIDGGTALTFTGADVSHRLVGGAILPGLGLQARSLSHTAIPQVELPDQLPDQLPDRWAMTTPSAIQSGTVYTTLAGIRDFVQGWWQAFPGSWIVLTGGDRTRLHNYLNAWSAQQPQAPEWMTRLVCDPSLIFWGIQSLRQNFASRVKGPSSEV